MKMLALIISFIVLLILLAIPIYIDLKNKKDREETIKWHREHPEARPFQEKYLIF